MIYCPSPQPCHLHLHRTTSGGGLGSQPAAPASLSALLSSYADYIRALRTSPGSPAVSLWCWTGCHVRWGSRTSFSHGEPLEGIRGSENRGEEVLLGNHKDATNKNGAAELVTRQPCARPLYPISERTAFSGSCSSNQRTLSIILHCRACSALWIGSLCKHREILPCRHVLLFTSIEESSCISVDRCRIWERAVV